MWEMEIEEIEAVLEKICDLHDKLSDAIHSISRSHFLSSIKSLRKSNDRFLSRKKKHSSFSNNKDSETDGSGNHQQTGFVFVKDFLFNDDDSDYIAIQEVKSLNVIRTALENLEDQLEVFHTVQVQQRAERDAAIARLEQSRIVLAMRLAEHQGKKCRVIEEALAFVGDVRDPARFVSPDYLYASALFPHGENFVLPEGKKSSNIFKFLINSFSFAKKSFKLDQMGEILGNAALVAISMLAFLHLHKVSCNNKYILDLPQEQEDAFNSGNVESSSGGRLTPLEVMLARG